MPFLGFLNEEKKYLVNVFQNQRHNIFWRARLHHVIVWSMQISFEISNWWQWPWRHEVRYTPWRSKNFEVCYSTWNGNNRSSMLTERKNKNTISSSFESTNAETSALRMTHEKRNYLYISKKILSKVNYVVQLGKYLENTKNDLILGV